jgi:hypothetical protein
MKSYIYIPSSLRTAARQLRGAFAQELETLPKRDFLRAWCSVAYLYPGLHPDGFEEPDSGWPRVLHRVAAEAWRRSNAGELTDNELYCYQATKARIRREREELARSMPWLLDDHFAI